MQPKPDFFGPQHAARFQDQSVVDRYHLRPVCPPETFPMLARLISDEPRAVLDVGCGTGDVARNLLNYVERIDAVDISLPMMEKGKSLPGGDSPKIRWLHGQAEDVELDPPYALVTAGQSIHWLDWHIVFPRLQQALTPRGFLAILGPEELPPPWANSLRATIKRYSTNQGYKPIDLIAELEQRRLFQKAGEIQTSAVPFRQPVNEYIEAYHAKSSLSRDHMTREAAAAFDREMREMLAQYANAGEITVQVVGHIVWGKPLGANP